MQRMMGKSLLPFFNGKVNLVRDENDWVAWESLGWRAVRQNKWKAVWLASPFGPDDWQLFDVVDDVSERNDLSDERKEKLNELILLWEDYSDEVGVVLPSTLIDLAD